MVPAFTVHVQVLAIALFLVRRAKLDSIVVAGAAYVSLAERNLLEHSSTAALG